MTLLERLARSLENPASNLADPEPWLVEAFGGGPTKAGVTVNARTGLTLSAVFSCVRVISESVGWLPLILYRRLAGGKGKERAVDHPLYSVFHDQANPYMTAQTFRETLTGHVASWGTAFAEIEFRGDGSVAALWPLLPDRTHVEWTRAGRVYWTDIQGRRVGLPESRVLAIPGFGFDGYQGYSPIGMMRQAIGVGLAAEELGARFFSNGAHLGVILKHPATLSDKAANRLRESKQMLLGGLANAHRLAVLEEGMDLARIGLPPEDAQLLETRKFTRSEVAGFYRVPAHLIGDLERATFSNIEHQGQEFVTQCLMSYLVRWEQAIRSKLFTDAERRELVVEHLVDAILRGDTKTRFESYAAGIQNGILTPNEARERENMNPSEFGDRLFVPANLMPLEAPADFGAEAEGADAGAGAVDQGDADRGRRGARATRSAVVRRRYQRAFATQFEPVVARIVRREVARARDLLALVEAGGSIATFVEDMRGFYVELEGIITRDLGPSYRAYAGLVLEEIVDELGRDLGAEAAAFERFVDAYMKGASRRYVEQSLEELAAALADGVGGVRDRLDSWEQGRAESTAREESVRGGGAFARTAYAMAGVEFLRWVSFGGCSICQNLSGKVVGVREAFAAAGDEFGAGEGNEPLRVGRDVKHPPLHKGCDCAIVAES